MKQSFNASKMLTILVIVLIVFLYVQYYAKYNTSYKILQTKLSNIDVNTLYEKYPIIIEDRLVRANTLTSTLFRYSYTSQSNTIQKGSPFVNLALNKYTIIYNIQSDMNINVISPFYKKDFTYAYANNLFRSVTPLAESKVEYVTIKLKKQQVLILPMYWSYQTELPHHTIILNDPLTSLINIFNIWFGTTRATKSTTSTRG